MWLNRFPVFAATCIFVFSLVLVQCGDAPAYILPDSGQTSCYTGLGYEAPCPALGQPYHGQDGNYIGAQLAYQDNSDGTVTDLNTGLVWQQSDDQNMNRSSHGEAEAYCGSLELGSYSDWRLPTQHELLSVVNYGRSNPSIHTTYFPGCLSDGYWSNDSSDTYGNYWYVDFYYGDVGGVLGWGARGDPMYIRCVRGESLSKSNFVMNDNGTVTDTVTGLIWQREALQNEYTWKQALSYCEALSLAGADDWKLPNIRELKTLIEFQSFGRSLNHLFRCWNMLWSSTSVSDYPDDAWGMDCSGDAVRGNKSPYYALCVREGRANHEWQSIAGILNQVTAGDLDGDGKSDLAGVTAAGEIFFSLDLENWEQLPGVLSQLASGDLNGDGKDDLVGITSSGQVYYTLDLRNWQWTTGILNQVAAGDLDGDGRADLAGLTSTGYVYYTLDLFNWTWLPGILAQLTTGDISADGKNDFIGIGSTGQIFHTVYLYLAETKDRYEWWSIPGVLSQIAAGDLNGDGRADLAGLTASGQVFYTTDGNWQSGSMFLRQLTCGDFDGDGKDDLAGVDDSGKIYYRLDVLNGS